MDLNQVPKTLVKFEWIPSHARLKENDEEHSACLWL